MNRARATFTTVSVAFFLAACGSTQTAQQPSEQGTGGNNPATGNGGAQSTNKSSSGGSKATTTKTGKGGNTAASQGNEGGASDGGEAGSEGGEASGGASSSKGSGSSKGGGSSTGGKSGSSTGGTKSSDSGNGGSGPGGQGGEATGGATTGPVITEPLVITSASNAYWKTDGKLTEATSGNADVTVNDASAAQTWDGWGGAFNELGWKYLSSKALQDEAMQLLFGVDGAHFNWGRIPMGASDYAESRYTLDDTGTDVTAASGEANRPAADTSLSKFSLARDEEKLIPFIKAAQGVRSDLRFWASPWTPPVWMKKGYKGDTQSDSEAKKPSYFDGGSMTTDSAILTAYAQYFTKFVQGYKDKGIKIEIVSPQNEPGYEQNYPSCLWEKDNYIAFIKLLGPAMKTLDVKLMLGTMSNAGDKVAGANRNDLDIASAVLADSTAKSFLTVAGVQWGVLGKINEGSTVGGLPIWATEHKCGNYPWNPQGYPSYNSTQAPNDLAYGVESWGYIRDAITKGKVTAYNAWNMVLDKNGLGNDTTRDWRQDSLLVVDGGKIIKTPAYYVFRHFSQYVQPSSKVVGATGGDTVAFKNPDGSIVAVMYNSGAAKTSIISIGGKKLSFSMPGSGWATVVVPK